MPTWITRALAGSFVLLSCAATAQSPAIWPPADTMEQRMAACTHCHGAQGRAGSDGYYPRLAGKPAGYLYHQLLNFQQGRRSYPLMTHLLKPLDKDYLQSMATHFANQQAPYPAPKPVALSQAQSARAQTLVRQGDAARDIAACASCHGESLMGTQPATPGLLGLPRDYLNAQLGAWRNGLRHAHAPDCMAHIAKALAPDDVAALSGWLASQPVPPGAGVAPAPTTAAPMRCGSAS
jgi:cytochrome c553